jgi:integrase
LIEKHLLPELGNIPIRKLETVQLNALYEKIKRRGYATPGGEHREYSAATLKRIHSAVSKLLADAQEKQYISENPAIAAKVPKVKSAPVDIEAADLDTRHFTKEQAQAFLNYLEEVETPLQMRVLYHISVSCGLRVGETVALRWSDIDFEKGFVSITKSTARTKKGQVDKPPKSKRSRRKVQIPQSTLALLKKHRGEQKELCFSLGTAWEGERSEKDRRLFIQHGQHIGRQMHHDTPGKTFQKLIARYNKAYPDKALPELTQHGLRHTFASLLIAQGVDIVTVSAMLGHADATVTMRVYAHEIEDNKVMASNIMDEILTTVAV